MLSPSVLPDYESVSRYAADWLIDRIRRHPSALTCLASGSTPTRTYELFTERAAMELEALRKVQLLKLDEWGGLAMDNPATCEQHLLRAIVKPLQMAGRYVGFNSKPHDPRAECARVAAWLAENGPIDTCVLGLGVNGHIGFNEPAEHLQPHAHVAKLSEESMTHAMLGKSSDRPAYGLTLGMADILQSRQILLLVAGSAKRPALERLLSGRITTQFPASLLHLHDNVQLICDAAAYPSESAP
ncbi:MAG: 6-phosphogluconolactonase [Planctomycetes bacterium]|nr:6-phosphogluconolactonase [Planctomycetota bacterium]